MFKKQLQPNFKGSIDHPLTTMLTLNETQLRFNDADGSWTAVSTAAAAAERRIAELEAQVEALTLGGGNNGAPVSAAAQQAADQTWERKYLALAAQHDKLKFKASVLMAFCVISENDHRCLKKEVLAEVAGKGAEMQQANMQLQGGDASVIAY
jgi:hypothetical protein